MEFDWRHLPHPEHPQGAGRVKTQSNYVPAHTCDIFNFISEG
jgi:hypothetical protein